MRKNFHVIPGDVGPFEIILTKSTAVKFARILNFLVRELNLSSRLTPDDKNKYRFIWSIDTFDEALKIFLWLTIINDSGNGDSIKIDNQMIKIKEWDAIYAAYRLLAIQIKKRLVW